MAKIKAQSIPRVTRQVSPQDTIAQFCYYYPQYKFNEARKMPYKRIAQMLRVVEIERAKTMKELVQIATAPHTAKGKGVGSLMKYYDKIISG